LILNDLTICASDRREHAKGGNQSAQSEFGAENKKGGKKAAAIMETCTLS